MVEQESRAEPVWRGRGTLLSRSERRRSLSGRGTRNSAGRTFWRGRGTLLSRSERRRWLRSMLRTCWRGRGKTPVLFRWELRVGGRRPACGRAHERAFARSRRYQKRPGRGRCSQIIKKSLVAGLPWYDSGSAACLGFFWSEFWQKKETGAYYIEGLRRIVRAAGCDSSFSWTFISNSSSTG